MKYSPPKLVTWWIALACLLIGVLGNLGIVTVPALAPFLFWVVVAGLVLLLLAAILPGL
jgi:heme A synthase